MRVYISGPMTGKPRNNVDAFQDAERRIATAGHFPVNPAYLSTAFGDLDELAAAFCEYYALKRGDYTDHPGTTQLRRIDLARLVLRADIAALETCDAICLLDGWQESTGARQELRVALERGMVIRMIQDFKPAEIAR